MSELPSGERDQAPLTAFGFKATSAAAISDFSHMVR
jgi:hypothetical protein